MSAIAIQYTQIQEKGKSSMKRLKGKVAVITGAGCGYGMSRGFPTIYAQEGANLVLNHYCQDPEKMDEFKRELENYGAQVVLIEGDISCEEVVQKLINAAIETFGRIDILLNVAGISAPKLLVDMSLEDWQRMLAVDLTSVFLTCRYAVPHMIAQRYGRIINLASQVAQKGSVEHCHYSAAKAGVIGFTKSLAREVGKYNITVNCIAPGPIETQLMGVVSDEWRRNKEAELVLPRFGELLEVLPTAVFLAAEPDGNLYTGQTLGPNLGDVML